MSIEAYRQGNNWSMTIKNALAGFQLITENKSDTFKQTIR